MKNSSSAAISTVYDRVHGLVTWGIIADKLAWLRRDLGNAHKRLDKMENRLNQTAAFHP